MAALYYYTARSAEGSFVRGSIEAQSDSYALASLRTRALFVTSLEAAGTARAAAAWSLQILPVRHEALVAFFRSFATLVTAGVSIRRSLDVTIEESRDGRLAEALRSVLSDIESGLSLSAALERHPREFESLYVAMVRAGESGGVLDEVLERIALVMERDRKLRKRLASSLAYPAVVATSALGLVVFLLSSIVPTFASLYAEMQLTLPPMTAALLSISRATHEPVLWITMSLAVAGASLLVLRARCSPYGRELMQRARLRMPVVGPIARKAAQARFARTLGSLLRSGVGLMDALGVTADAIGNAVYAASVDRLSQALREGETLARPLAESGSYEPLFVQLVRVGEETGTLDDMLLRLAEYYEVDVEAALATLGAAIEPLLIVFLGGVVGAIVSAIFIPLYTMIGSIR